MLLRDVLNEAKMRRSFSVVVLMLTVVAPVFAEDEKADAASVNLRRTALPGSSVSRPDALPILYASYSALQAYDVYSTKQALALGAREANPLMQGVVGNTGAFVAMKVGVGVATIVAAERLWKTNKAAAIGVMIAGNSVAAIVAARNARTLQTLR